MIQVLAVIHGSQGRCGDLRSELRWGIECHVAHPTLVLTLLVSMLVTWLEAAKLTMGFQAPWNISHPFSVQKLGVGLQIAMDKINSETVDLGNFSWEFTYTNSTCSTNRVSCCFHQPGPERTDSCPVRTSMLRSSRDRV